MLFRICNDVIRGMIQRQVPVKAWNFFRDATYISNYGRTQIRSFVLSHSNRNKEDPCQAPDVYKISPLCPPRGYEFKKQSASLKCKTKKVSAPKKEQSKDETSKNKDKKDVQPPPTKKEEKAEKNKSKKCEEKTASASPVTQEPKKKEGPPKQDKKESPKKDEKSTAPSPGKNDPKKKEGSAKTDEKDCSELKGLSKKDGSKKEKPKMENSKCKPSSGPPDCGKPKDKCADTDISASKLKPNAVKKRQPVEPECGEKPPKSEGGEPKPTSQLKPAAEAKPACQPKAASGTQGVKNKKKEEDQTPPCSVLPWPFNLMQKPNTRNLQKEKKQQDKKMKEQGKTGKTEEKNLNSPLKKMVTVTQPNICHFIKPKPNNISNKIFSLDKVKYFQSSVKNEMSKSKNPPSPCPPCTLGDLKISDETEKLMVKMRATARANRRHEPEWSCEGKKLPNACLVPQDGWKQTQNFVLMRDPAEIEKSGRKKSESPRLVGRKLRKRLVYVKVCSN